MKYIAFYDTSDNGNEKRSVNDAIKGIIEYNTSVFSSFEKVEVISPTRTLNTKGYYHSRVTQISERVSLRLPASFGVKTVLGRTVSLAWIQIWLLLYLFFHTKRGEKVVFYHSLATMRIILLLTKLKRIKPIIEFREIYSDIDKVKPRIREKELSYYKCAYGYIFPSEALKNSLDIGDKPYVLAPGSYLTYNYIDSFFDNRYHLVYAGNLRKDKGGSYVAIECAKYLSDQYVLHILGGGTPDEVSDIKKEVNNANEEASTTIVYEGQMSGEEFYRFLCKCDIGLAVQKPGDYNNTSFPSKILTYLGCDLMVITPYIEAVRFSPVSDLVNFYDINDVKQLSSVIMQCTEKKFDSRNELRLLDKQLKEDLTRLFI